MVLMHIYVTCLFWCDVNYRYSKGVTSFGEDYFDEMGTLRDDMFYDYDL